MPESSEELAIQRLPAKQRMSSRSRALRRENMPHEATPMTGTPWSLTNQ